MGILIYYSTTHASVTVGSFFLANYRKEKNPLSPDEGEEIKHQRKQSPLNFGAESDSHS